MAFDGQRLSGRSRMRVAVIGSGISGLSAAWLLAKEHDVALFEASGRIGGHSNTVDVPLPGGRTVPVDAGFIVYNEPAYPNLTALFAHLGVATENACMSFGASLRGGALEYAGKTLSSVFAMRRNALNPSYWGMLRDITRFHCDARAALAAGLPHSVSLCEFVRERRYGAAFARDFLAPMASAIWSTPSENILDYSAIAFLKFYDNHGLLQVLNLPTWRTVSGGARRYVEAMLKDYRGETRLRAPVRCVTRKAGGVLVDGEAFDACLVAAHANDALALLNAPDDEDRAILGAFRYNENKAYVHFDAAQMPRRRRVWSSWNYVGDGARSSATYWMNRLQNLDCAEDVFVTLNPARPIDPSKIVAAFDYTHPMFDLGAATAQRELWRLQGKGGVWFAGAHFGQGFHEDGLQAGLAAAEDLGSVRRPWTVPDESGRIHLRASQRQAA